jgi:hypothetical protein
MVPAQVVRKLAAMVAANARMSQFGTKRLLVADRDTTGGVAIVLAANRSKQPCNADALHRAGISRRQRFYGSHAEQRAKATRDATGLDRHLHCPSRVKYGLTCSASPGRAADQVR